MRHSSSSPLTATPSWTVKMSASSPTIVIPVSGTGGRLPSPPRQQQQQQQRPGVDSVVSTNQNQYPTAKAVSLSVANLPQQTAAIPLIIGQQNVVSGGVGASVSISAAPAKYGYHPVAQQPQTTATLLNSINPAAVMGGGGSGNGFQLSNCGPGGITRIVDSSGNILHLPSGTAAAAVNSNSGTTFSTLLRVNGNGSVDNVLGEYRRGSVGARDKE